MATNMDKILLSHGAGGRLMHELVESLFLREFDNPVLKEAMDSGIVTIGNRKVAFTTDSYVVNPIFFPGGDIGSLAVYGTVNDLAVCGARPLYISLGLIIEEGFEKKILARIASSIKAAAKRSGVIVVTGDTKVVERGSCDGIFINTSGLGEIFYEGLSTEKIRAGDAVVISGPLGDHAIAVLSKREGLDLGVPVKSDSAPLNGLIGHVLRASKKVRFMRDPTRGGLATTINEIVRGLRVGIALDERAIPVKGPTLSACELLGYDPLYLACEGRVVIVVAGEDASRIVNIMRNHPLGKGARIIGHVTKDCGGKVYLKTASGGKRLVDMLAGDQLPRIC